MELYCSVRAIGKGDGGRTACGSSAYRACDKVIDNAGRVHDYRRKSGYVIGGIELPDGAPEELLDRQLLWQRHDAKEVRKDAQIFREIEFALHNELDDYHAALVCQTVAKSLVGAGMCVQWDIHDPVYKDGHRNRHCHMMLTMRELLSDGTFGKKRRDWNRYNGGANMADELRPLVARLQNAVLDKLGVADRVEYESFAKRGIDRIPTMHEGVTARAMAGKGQLTYRVLLNQKIQEINREHASYIERLERYREARAELSEMVLRQAGEYHDDLDLVIQASLGVRDAADGPDALEEPTPPTREQLYQTIRDINGQAAGLRKDAAKIKKIRKALYTAKNLTSLQGLDEDQKKQLAWATGYLKWAGMTDMSSATIDKAIDQFRESNTSCRVEERRLATAREAAYRDLQELRRAEIDARHRVKIER